MSEDTVPPGQNGPKTTTTTTTDSPVVPKNCDEEIINHVQDAIVKIKQTKQQCNIARIFKYLKEELSGDEKIAQLTEKCLIRQLEMAVRDGILSRKYGSSVSASGDEQTVVARSQSASVAAAGNKVNVVFKLPVGELRFKSESQVSRMK